MVFPSSGGNRLANKFLCKVNEPSSISFKLSELLDTGLLVRLGWIPLQNIKLNTCVFGSAIESLPPAQRGRVWFRL